MSLKLTTNENSPFYQKFFLNKIKDKMYLSSVIFIIISFIASAQTDTSKIEIPDWALPGSPSHQQVPPPKDFHRETRTENMKIGIFDGVSDVGGALVPGSSFYDKSADEYTIISAGYNIWYTRDEFRYLWKKMSGDVSLSADVKFPDTTGYGDRKVVLIIRQTLEDDSKEIMVALHGAGLMHMAWRPEKGEELQEMRIEEDSATRLGIEKDGNDFTAFIKMPGETMHNSGETVQLQFDEPFYVGIGFTSHLPATVDTGIFSNVVLENKTGGVQ
tara:strand:+ start:202 stop:1020 length:819 start_codon:yes stop_codon:yes gene_type:complete